MEYHTLELCGLRRELPLVYVAKKTRLAQWSMLGDVELVDKLADELEKILKQFKFEYLVAPEVRVLPLVHGIALRLGQKTFVVCRRSVKPYMVDPVILKPLPHFPKHVAQMVIDGRDVKLVEGRRVVVIDDVVSTGVTMRMMTKLMEKVGAKVVKLVGVIKQGKQFDDLAEMINLGELPIFKDV